MRDDVTIGRLAIRMGDEVSPDARITHRRRALAVLDQAVLTPRALPPQAILVVRRLQDPDPHALFDPEPLLAASRWGDRARDRLDHLWRTAARPAREAVPSGCEAVWFADRAEWLACLSLDLLYGVAQGRWYWWTWFQRGTLARDPSPGALWLRESDAVPAALALIAAARPAAAAELVAALSPPEARAVLESIAAAYALPVGAPAALPAPVRARLLDVLPHASRLAVRALPVPDDAAESARDPRRDLLLLALAVAAAPALTQRILSAAPPLPSAYLPLPDVVQPYVEPPPPAEIPRAVAESALEDAHPASGSEAASPAQSIAAAPDVDSAQIFTDTGDTGSPFLLDERPVSESGDVSDAAVTDWGAPVLTAFGSVFYLINVIQALSLTDAADAINPWMMLYILTESALGELPPDPLWGLLLTLAGDDVDPQAAGAWLARHGDTVGAWLAERLDQPERLPQILTQPARLHVTRTHIDVLFALDQIDLELRLIGLDRDPGWLPAFGRVVLLHYE
jgi:hypothetical protein